MSHTTTPKNIDWDAQPLGKLPDSELADQLGVAVRSVWHARKVRNIAPCNPDMWRSSRNAGIDWDKQPLGHDSDAELGRKLNVHQTAVWGARRARGIPPFSGREQESP